MDNQLDGVCFKTRLLSKNPLHSCNKKTWLYAQIFPVLNRLSVCKLEPILQQNS